MNNLLKLAGFIFTVAVLSCGTNGPDTPHSTPIDSTNIYGTAPADYQHDANDAMLPDEPKEGDRANTPDGDSIPSVRSGK
jgi:hypothetical protein